MVQPVDATKLLVLMVAGAIIGAVGLFLILRPKSENAAKIELFGMKFESSSAGLLVFVIGAAFLAVPLFVPEKGAGSWPSTPEVTQDAPEGKTTAAAQRATSTPGTAPELRAQSGERITEKEPNDTQITPNLLVPAQRVSGSVDSDEHDWFLVQAPSEGWAGHEIMFKHVGGGWLYLDVYNAREEHIGKLRTNAGAEYLQIEPKTEGLMTFKVTTSLSPADYEFAVLPPD